MGAPLGNKHGVGHGRPPEPHNLTKEQLHELGRELLDWAHSEEFKDAVHLDEFAIIKKKLTWKQWKAIFQRDSFREYYETAQKMMSFNLLRNKDMHDAMGNRYLCFYDRQLRDFEKEVKKEDVEIKLKDPSQFANLGVELARMNDFFCRVQSMQPSKSKESEEDRKS